MKPKVNVPISYIMQNVTVTVKITGLIKWRFQFWAARLLFGLGAFIANCNLDFKRR